jgi:hypothetical protein
VVAGGASLGVLLVVLAACGAAGSSSASSAGGAAAAPGIARVAPGRPGAATGTGTGTGTVSRLDSGGTATSSGAGSTVPGALPAANGPDIVRTGSLTLTVRPGLTVAAAAQRATSVALGAGGYVGDSEVSTGRGAEANLTLDVPSASLASVMSRIGALAGLHVDSTSQQGQDVSGEVSNIGAQLASLQAARSQYLTLLAKASSIGAVLAVQERIDTLQTEIQQLQAQQRQLDTQVSYASLSVFITGPGAHITRPGHGSGWGRELHHAWRSFVGGLQDVVGALGALLLALIVIAALALAVILGLRVGRRIPPHVRRWTTPTTDGHDGHDGRGGHEDHDDTSPKVGV